MYTLRPPAVYAHESVLRVPAYRARVERVVAALAEPRPIIPYTDADLPALIREGGLLAGRRPMAELAPVPDPILLFNTFRFDGPEAARARMAALDAAGIRKAPRSLLGDDAFIWFHANLESDEHRHDKVCRPCWRIHLQEGCLHKCTYCGLGGLLVAMVNVDAYCRHLRTLIDRHPWQSTYLLDDDGDPPCLEPELGTLPELIEFFGTLEQRYLIVHTKTWNTAWLRGLRHNGNTIFVWSLSGANQSRLIEGNTGTTDERIEAARVAQEAGYPIRYKFKPIVPLKTWREDAADAVRRLFARTRPDVISLCVFMWNTYPEMLRRLPVDLLDPAFVKAAEESQAEMAGTRTMPFPPAVRQAIYAHYVAEIRKYDREIPISLSTETFAMWDAMREQLGCTATNYVCGCGPQCTPGARKLACHPFKTAVRNDAGLVPGVAVRACS